jgi:hypothetical protein
VKAKNEMKIVLFLIAFVLLVSIFSCEKEDNKTPVISNEITIHSLVASHNPVKAWDTTTISCFATGDDLIYKWECDHGNFNGSGVQVKYAAGECCVGTNSITCTVSNHTGEVSKVIQIVVTSYFEGGK